MPVPVTPSGVLNAVAAISSHNVWAVGSNGLGTTLVEHWNGAAWRIVRAPSPPGSALLAITAPSAADIWAVGRSHLTNGYNATSQRPLIEHWNGAVWKIVPSPKLPPGAQLEGVSGLTFRDIWAVGEQLKPGETSVGLTEHWNGSAWSFVSSPQARAGAGFTDELKAVVELSPTNVWAVGAGSGSDLIEHWNGHAWATISSHFNSGSELHAVAALSPSDIWAAGMDANGHAYAEHWGGMRWRTITIPALAGGSSPFSEINAFAAISTNDVWAVGDQPTRNSRDRALIDHWDGHRWRAFYGMVPGGAGFSNLFGVAAVSSAAVWAVGTGGIHVTSLDSSGSYAGANTGPHVGVALVGRWNGRKWKKATSPNPMGASAELNAVDVPSGSSAWAVGDRLDRGYDRGLAERWNGRRWSVTLTPRISGRNAYLQSIESAGSDEAWAVGWTASAGGSDYRGLLEHWNGRRWSMVSGANAPPPGELLDVSALTSRDVWAVGYAQRSGRPSAPLVEQWNGATWNRMPNPPHMHRAGAVVVISRRDVWVSSGDGYTVDRWNGTGWSRFSSPGGSALAASSPHDVWSAGSTSSTFGDDPTYYTPLAARWNGEKWQEVNILDPWPSDQVVGFYGVTDITPSNVWAVGVSDAGMLAEHWNGKAFGIVKTAGSIPSTGMLYGVDGTSAAVWAVGSYDGDGGLIPVAERFAPCRA